MAVLVEVINESGSGVSTSSDIFAAGDGAHVSPGAHRQPLTVGGARVVFCYPWLFDQVFSYYASDGFSNSLDVWSESFHLRLNGEIAFA